MFSSFRSNHQPSVQHSAKINKPVNGINSLIVVSVFVKNHAVVPPITSAFDENGAFFVTTSSWCNQTDAKYPASTNITPVKNGQASKTSCKKNNVLSCCSGWDILRYISLIIKYFAMRKQSARWSVSILGM